ncbi:hypothetical protein GDO81_024598 [Engystomops pustulosus]|uniref:BPTI/Kunitz inhibitor domain-containing protein n=1 Tax=Engystomops pustulosus TaxID=76066 RepID=A0AAV6Z2R4_ENGPU|nr:hypothetical protein GDO81_024598 [Engystomops pustulosus]
MGNECRVEGATAACALPPDAGSCEEQLTRYHYDPSSMTCKTFKYGGCGGNMNNFVEYKDCLQTCKTSAACYLPIEEGPCKASIPRWGFDAAQGKCVSFNFGGCKRNGNNFKSENKCKKKCK